MTRATEQRAVRTRRPRGSGAGLARVAARTLASPPAVATLALAILAEVREAGLLNDATEHVSFRVPKALVEAAKKNTGLASMTDLGLLALATLARPDPVAEVMKRTRGKLGRHHGLEY